MTDTDQSPVEGGPGDQPDGGPAEEMAVAFPATPTFTRIGRVAVVGLALRLGVDVSTVERLRGAVDAAVSALQGAGRINATASWDGDNLEISLTNPDVSIAEPQSLRDELQESLSAEVGQVEADGHSIRLTLPTTRR
jgi:hypothetical protein